MTDWNEEFKKKYNKPVIEQRTVGFSGIDPQQKSADVDVDAAVQNALNKIQLLIDGGEITLPDYPTPEPIIVPQPTPIVFEEIDHERLGNLLGGTDEGHYHLTGDELDKLRNMPTSGIQGASGRDGRDGQSATVSIGTVTTLAAGSPASVTNSGTSSNAILNFSIPRGADGHDGVDGHDGHDGHDGVDGITPNISVGTVTTGAAGSQAKVTKRGTATEILLDFTIPKGDKGDTGAAGADGHDGQDATSSDVQHEELPDLLGGRAEQHYHMTQREYTRLGIMIRAFFRHDESDEMTIPNPDAPDNPYHIDLPDGEFHDLPIGTAPMWVNHDLPGIHTNNTGTMTYGYIPINAGGVETTMLAGCNTSESIKIGSNLQVSTVGWAIEDSFHITAILPQIVATTSSAGSVSRNNVNLKYRCTGSARAICVIGMLGYNESAIENDGDFYLYGYYGDVSGVSSGEFATNDTSTIQSAAKSKALSQAKASSTTITKVLVNKIEGAGWPIDYVVFNKVGFIYRVLYSNGYIRKLSFKNDNPTQTEASLLSWGDTSQIKSGDTTFNVGVHGRIAYSPDSQLLCVCGIDGTATSTDGVAWELHTDDSVPKNLTDLSYREDLGCLFARSLNTKLFYVSGDGITWNALNSVPIPLETIACVDYNPDLGWYCACGGTGKHVYFSKDLNTWVATQVTNGAAIGMGSVIWHGGAKKYVLMPTSGSYYYTFDPYQWMDID